MQANRAILTNKSVYTQEPVDLEGFKVSKGTHYTQWMNGWLGNILLADLCRKGGLVGCQVLIDQFSALGLAKYLRLFG